MKKQFLRQTLAIALLAAVSPNLWAEQQLPADETRPLNATISPSGLSMISIDGSKITNVKYFKDELDVQKDDRTGQAFVEPLTTKKKITLFVTSESNKTYLLNLSPTGKAGDSIVIQEQTALMNQYRQQQQQLANIPKPVTTTQDSYIRAVKGLMIAVANNNLAGQGVQGTEAYQEIPLWNEVIFIRKKRYTAADLYAEEYALTNVSGKQMVLDEREFAKSGVVSVAIMDHILPPGASTQVIITYSRGN